LHVTGRAEQPQLLLSDHGGVRLLPLSAGNLAWALPPQVQGSVALSAEPELLALAQAQLQGDVQPWPRTERWAAAARPKWDLADGLLMRRRAQRSALQWLQAPRWRMARWATLGLVAVQLVGFNALAWNQSMQLQARREQMRQLLVQSFPQAKAWPEVDPPVQMQREIERLQSASTEPAAGDLPVMLGAVLAALPPERAPQALDYGTGLLRLQGLELTAGQVQALNQQLLAQGYSVQAQGQDLVVRARP
jgi:general secretion pathway protein L